MTLRALLVFAGLLATAAGCGAERLPASGAANDPRPGSTADVISAAPRDTAASTVRPSLKAPGELPSRVVIADLGIDLPVISGDVTLPGNPPDYPLCDVAHYLTTYRYLGQDGSTAWIYAHAREGMFLPLLEASTVDDGSSLIGMFVDVYTTGQRRHRYRIVDVLRHATDRRIATGVPATARRLVLQTSEGPRGTVPKLQVAADFVESSVVAPGTPDPRAKPRVCFVP